MACCFVLSSSKVLLSDLGKVKPWMHLDVNARQERKVMRRQDEGPRLLIVGRVFDNDN
jgi:hypothetical protein